MLAPLSVAAAQPRCDAKDVHRNAAAHAELIRAAHARVVVFPELSLTGYDLDAPVVDPAGPELGALVEACAGTGSVALAGAPVQDADGHRYIATLVITGDGAASAYRKVWLGAEEQKRFHPGGPPTVYEVDGWRLGLAICRETGVAAHTEALSTLGVDAYIAGLVMHPEELDEQDARGRRIATALGAPVALAGFAGAAGPGYDTTAGGSAVWAADGTVLARAGCDAGEIIRATLVPRC
jgi:predicted amidohydrolase